MKQEHRPCKCERERGQHYCDPTVGSTSVRVAVPLLFLVQIEAGTDGPRRAFQRQTLSALRDKGKIYQLNTGRIPFQSSPNKGIRCALGHSRAHVTQPAESPKSLEIKQRTGGGNLWLAVVLKFPVCLSRQTPAIQLSDPPPAPVAVPTPLTLLIYSRLESMARVMSSSCKLRLHYDKVPPQHRSHAFPAGASNVRMVTLEPA